LLDYAYRRGAAGVGDEGRPVGSMEGPFSTCLISIGPTRWPLAATRESDSIENALSGMPCPHTATPGLQAAVPTLVQDSPPLPQTFALSVPMNRNEKHLSSRTLAKLEASIRLDHFNDTLTIYLSAMNHDFSDNRIYLDSVPDTNRSAFKFPLPQTAMDFTGERFVSGLDGQIKHEHYHRYLFAARYCVDKDVLDVASGEGYGSSLLSQVARQVIGVDLDQASVDYANRTYLSQNVSFKQGDAVELPIADGSVDVVVSFETIEHFAEHKRFLLEVTRVLRPGGLIVVSSPNKPVYDKHNSKANPFHVQELDRRELVDLLRQNFSHIAICDQRAVHGSVILFTDGLDQAALETFESNDGRLFMREPNFANVSYFVALASSCPIPIPHSSLLHDEAHVAGLHAALEQLNQSRISAQNELTTVVAEWEKMLAQTQARLSEEREQAAAKFAEELARITRDREHLNESLEDLRSQVAANVQKVEQAEAEARHFRLLANDREVSIANLNELTARQNADLQAAKEHLHQVFTSTSWTLSRPIRIIGRFKRRPPQVFRGALKFLWWAITLRLWERLRERQSVRFIRTSGHFDVSYYLSRYPDVAISGIDPALHYWRHGAAEERDPSPDFSTAAYRSRHPELSLMTNPLADAIQNRRLADGRTQRPYVSAQLVAVPSPPTIVDALDADLESGTRVIATLSYADHEVPEITIIVDARGETEAVERTLRVIAAEAEHLPTELFILVTLGSELILAGARRVAIDDHSALSSIEGVLSQSRTSFVAFVDSATAVEPGAIAAGLATLVRSNNVAVVSGLRYSPTGEVVDAGLCVAADGSVRGRGAGLSLDHYEVNSMLDVEAFSPGLVMFEKTVWQTAGGIRTSFSNSSYAAFDLSVRMRKVGQRVVCQPLLRAQVLTPNSDGSSASTDELERFFELWGSTVEYAKRHVRPRVLFMDLFTPAPDRDAGSNVIWWYFKIFQDLGYRVTFLPAMDLTPFEPYTSDMRQAGIECVTLPSATSVEQYLRENAASFNVVIIYRAPLANGYIDMIRRIAPLSRIIFNTVDLHFLREQREAELLGSVDLAHSSRNTKRIELDAIRKADCTIILSQTEHDLLHAIVPDARKQFIPLTQPIPGSEAPYDSRRDVAFIGSFAHRPNVDALEYLTQEIWPLVHAEVPDLKLIVVGSGVTEEVEAYGDVVTGIEIRGFVTDLSVLLRTCRLTVAPLRFGAGMKGKVVNSLAHGVPCIASAIAVEGTGLVVDQDILVANDPASTARAIIRAYTDRTLWMQLSEKGVIFAEENFSIQVVTKSIQDMLRSLELPVSYDPFKSRPL
jgi:2-polyprenyl-3-methyl-5-hydroxy-6-metoxy-1,4-benzoquinol methylase/glycosyltransferase involved in cell wall biosynthesis